MHFCLSMVLFSILSSLANGRIPSPCDEEPILVECDTETNPDPQKKTTFLIKNNSEVKIKATIKCKGAAVSFSLCAVKGPVDDTVGFWVVEIDEGSAPKCFAFFYLGGLANKFTTTCKGGGFKIEQEFVIRKPTDEPSQQSPPNMPSEIPSVAPLSSSGPSTTPSTSLGPHVSSSPARGSMKGFDITVQSELSPAFTPAFLDQMRRWEEIIVGDVPDVFVSADSSSVYDILTSVGFDDPDFIPCLLPGFIDDYYICVVDGFIDGAGDENGSVLGWAGSFMFRSNPNAPALPIAGIAKFEAVELQGLADDGLFDELVLHEVGHGLGAVHTARQDGCPSSSFSDSPQANTRFQELSKCTSLAPTDGECGHWEYQCFDGRPFGGSAELMVPFIAPGMLISEVTIGNLEDAGYTVDYGAAANYTIFGWGCQCGPNNRIQRDTPPTPPQLSPEGRERANALARQLFVQPLSAASDAPVNGPQLALSSTIEIYYLENGVIFSVKVGH